MTPRSPSFSLGMPERFPPPYSIHELPEAFEVRDATGFKLTWFHFSVREVVGTNPDRMTRQQAYAFAKAFARLPELLNASA